MSLLVSQLTTGTVATPGLGQATWTGLAPTVVTPNTIPIGLGQATWTGLAPTVTVAVVAAPGLGQATWAGLAPTIITPNTVPIGLGQATWTGLAPTIQIAIVVAPGVGAATWTGLAPTAVTTANVVVTPGIGNALWTGIALAGQAAPVVGGSTGRRKRTYRVNERERKPVPYFELEEPVSSEPRTGTLRCRGLAPRVLISDAESERRLIIDFVDDEDVALALTMAETWMSQ